MVLIGFFGTSFALLVMSEINKQTQRSIQKTASDVEQEMQALAERRCLLSGDELERMELLHAKAMSHVPTKQKARVVELWTKPIDQLSQDEYAERLQATQDALNRLPPEEKQEFQELLTRAFLEAAAQQENATPDATVNHSAPTGDTHGLTWNRVHALLADPSLTTREKKRLWAKDFRGKRVTWRGQVVMTMLDALNIKFQMNPQFRRAIDVSIFIREDQRAKVDQIYSMRTYTFSGRLDSYPGGVLPVYLQNGVVSIDVVSNKSVNSYMSHH